MNSLNEEDDSEEEEEDFDVEMENEVQVSGRAEDIERLFLNHEDSCMRQTKFTRLPCSAHKVHLVSDKSVNSKHVNFGKSIKKARSFIVKYRTSSKAKAALLSSYPKKLPGYVKTRW